MLDAALRWLHGQEWVNTSLLHSISSVWVWGALLRRELLSIPQNLFTFINRNEPRTVRWWKTARAEIKLMIDTLPVMVADVGAPLYDTVFASDAMGAEDGGVDHGGWGAVACQPGLEIIHRLYETGCKPGFTVLDFNANVGRLKRPDLELQRRIPFTRCPAELFKEDLLWTELGAGRWQYKDHITLGEARGSLRVLNAVALTHRGARAKVLSLMDNLAWAGAAAKGRSPSPALNALLRKRCAMSIASRICLLLPWTDTHSMPADAISRRVPGQMPG